MVKMVNFQSYMYSDLVSDAEVTMPNSRQIIHNYARHIFESKRNIRVMEISWYSNENCRSKCVWTHVYRPNTNISIIFFHWKRKNYGAWIYTNTLWFPPAIPTRLFHICRKLTCTTKTHMTFLENKPDFCIWR